MRLLITTQALDRKDPILGFFHRWVEEFAKHCEQVTVICLRKGDYELPPNVHVFALGGSTRISRASVLLKETFRFRGNYDAVFVHMNPEYLVAAGWLWRLLGKKTSLWYTHKHVDLKLRIATLFAQIVFTASKESFRLNTSKLRVLGHGIDTDFFSPSDVAREEWWLSAGRLTKSKRHDRAIRLAHEAHKELRIAGGGPERGNLEALAQDLGARVQFLGPMTQSQLRDLYQRAALLVHTSETGSLDKVTLEAVAVGLPVRTDDPALKELEGASPEYVRKNHSLDVLIARIMSELTA